jgi:hypothetical protein
MLNFAVTPKEIRQARAQLGTIFAIVGKLAAEGLQLTAAGAQYMEDRMGVRWEYMTLDVSNWEFGEMHARLAGLEHDGWEVAAPGMPRLRPVGTEGELQLVLRRQAQKRAADLKAMSA